MHYYQFNIADYRKDTQHLSAIEHYIYRELMDWYYLDEQPIPKKTQLVIRRLRLVSENNQDLTNVLEEFFTETDEGWSHGRIDDEIERYHARVDTAKANGSKGGRPKKPKKTQSVNSANPIITEPKANQEPRTNNHKPIVKSRAAPFAPPSVNEVADYAFNNGYPLDAERFVDHYESNGWVVGKAKMKSWQAAARNWSNRDKKEKQDKNPQGKTRGTSIADDLNDTSWAN